MMNNGRKNECKNGRIKNPAPHAGIVPGLALAAALAAAAPPWLGGLATAGLGAAGWMLAPSALAQGAGSGKEGEGQQRGSGQGGGGLGASGSGPQGSGAQGDSHTAPGTDFAPGSGAKKSGDDNDAVTNKDVQRLYTPPPQDRAAPANAEKPAR